MLMSAYLIENRGVTKVKGRDYDHTLDGLCRTLYVKRDSAIKAGAWELSKVIEGHYEGSDHQFGSKVLLNMILDRMVWLEDNLDPSKGGKLVHDFGGPDGLELRLTVFSMELPTTYKRPE